MSNRRRCGGVIGAGFLVMTVELATAAALPRTAPPLPAPRVTGYQPRVTGYQPRIVSYQPRITDVAPHPTSPSTVSVLSDVLFAFDSATLSPQTQAVLDQVVNRLRTAPAGQVVVTGYTDSIGTGSYNLQLSQRRAAAVQRYLAAHVRRQDLTYRVVGMGEAHPVAPNTNPDGSDNPTGRARNRRVTITVP